MTAAGFDSQVGYALEGTAGVYQAPTRAIEHVKAGLRLEVDRIVSKGIKAGRRHQGRWFPGAQRVRGTVAHECAPANIGMLLRPMFGAVITSGAGPYTHTFTPGVKAETETLTVQVGKPDEGGTVRSFSYLGCQITGATFSAKVGETVMMEVDFYGQHLDTGQALVAASYASGWAPFTFLHGVVTIAGSEYAVSAASLKVDNGLQVDRHVLRSTTPSRPRLSKESGFREWTGVLESDFFDLTALNRFINGTEASVVLAFTSGTHSLTFTGNARFDGEDPTVDGPEMLKLRMPVVFNSTTSDAAAMTCVLVNSDATP